jgi:uncharacterized phage protein (TIGR02216 family)
LNAAAGPSAGFPWQEIMALGLGLLRLSPAAFWAMTLPELAALARLAGPVLVAPGRAELEELMRRFPDEARGRFSDDR